MNTVMENTKHQLNSSTKYAPLVEGISAINFHENREGTEMMITLCNGKPLCPDFPELAGQLADALGVKAVIGRAKKEKAISLSNNLICNNAFVTERMYIRSDNSLSVAATDAPTPPVRTMVYAQPEGSFSNPNGDIAELTANWLCDKMQREGMKAQNRKFIEFYCGNANHGCYLAEYFTEVLGVEIDRELCEAAKINFENNGIVNGVIINKPAEEVAKRRHLYAFNEKDFMLVDPPRAGLDSLTLQLVREFKSVIYIACDARSLARDLRANGLGESHDVRYMAAFDHFPWHAEFLEVVCWLERKED
jgi:tRNA/tmRNA/rRNA uracil-C5-methylase (TrmA/RlmC/RlmD family)